MKKKFLLGLLALLGFAAEPAFGAATPWVFKGASAMALFDSASCKFQFVTGSADPSSSATDGCKGSVYCRTGASGGTCYVKSDDGSSTNWTAIATGSSGVTTLAAVGSSPNANGATISGSTLNLQPADATNPGVVTTGAQTFAGAKTFSSTIVGSVSGNAATATALAANPADCAVGQVSTGVDASGVAQCVDIADPSLVLYRVWDFIGYTQAGATPDDGWFGNVGGGGLTNTLGGYWEDATHPGLVQMRSGTGATDFATIGQGNIISHGQGVFSLEFLLMLEDLSDGTNTFVVMVGTNSTLGAATNYTTGCGFKYTDAVNGGEWEFICGTAGTRTTVDTNVAVVADSWIKLRYECNAACTSCQAYINGSAAGSAVTSNCPTSNSSAPMVHIEKTLGAASRSLYVDYAKIKYVFTTPR